MMCTLRCPSRGSADLPLRDVLRTTLPDRVRLDGWWLETPRRSRRNPLVPAAAFLMLEEVLSTWTEHWMVVLGPVLIFVVLFARRGIYGWLVGREDEP